MVSHWRETRKWATMDGKIDIFNLLLLVLAVVIFLKLRNVLGRRTGHERPPYDPFSAGDAKSGPVERTQDQGNVITMPGRGAAGAPMPPPSNTEDRNKQFADMAAKHAVAGPGLVDIARVDPSFDPDRFVIGAKAAYEMIVQAYGEGNRKALKPLLVSDVYDGFIANIEAREQRKETIETTFVGIARADLVDASLKGSTAEVTVKFVSELYSVTRREAVIVEGDPKVKREVTDIWTFARETSSRDPNWKLVRTQAAS